MRSVNTCYQGGGCLHDQLGHREEGHHRDQGEHGPSVMSCHVMSCPYAMSCHVMAGVMWPLLAAAGHKNTFVTFSALLCVEDDSVTQSTDSWPHHHILISTYLKQKHCLCENYYLKLFEIESKSIMKWGLRSKWGNRRNYGHRRSSYKRVQFSSLNTYPI